MRSRSQGYLLLATSILIIFGFFLFTGCSELPNKPESTGDFSIAEFEKIFTNPNPPILPDNIAVSKLVIPKIGATIPIDIEPDKEAYFVVPKNSIDSKTQISISVQRINVPGRTVLQFTFGPHGTEFSPEAHLILNKDLFHDEDMERVEWYYFNPQAFSFELEAVSPIIDGKVDIPVSHFSKYFGLSQGGQ